MKIGSERMVNNDVKIAFAINDNYSPYLAVAIKSILENSNPNRKYLIYIFSCSCYTYCGHAIISFSLL